ncbi:MAG: ribosome-binding factor A, partial [Candidatus Competibacteraceae bacterium]|nr:ribosome-binding factor A [Candidatus Competibacteraceae bacterium]
MALRNSEGWMRREVGKHLRMRFTPALRFFPDDTLDNVYKLEEVLEQIHEEQEAAPMLQTDA